jgi:hypothetical protein
MQSEARHRERDMTGRAPIRQRHFILVSKYRLSVTLRSRWH